MSTRVMIDLNVRVRGNATYVGFEDVDGPIAVGDEVAVFEPESRLEGSGRIAEIDATNRLVYLSVDWAGLRPGCRGRRGARRGGARCGARLDQPG